MAHSELDRFLTATDLDASLAARGVLAPLDDDDRASIRAALTAGNAQAIANLLFHPDLLPDELRLPTLLDALVKPPNPYFTLAAVVGYKASK